MVNEVLITYGTAVTLEGSGASTNNNAVAQANDASYTLATSGSYYPHARFVLGFTTATAATESSIVGLYVRPINIDGTADAEAPESAAFRNKFVGSFVANNVTTLQYSETYGYDLPAEGDYYIDNQTGQTISAGWTLKATPFTFKPGT